MKLFGATSEHFLKIPLIRGHYSLCSGRSYYQYYISYTRIIVITKHPLTHPSFLAASIHCILGLCSVKYILIRIKIFGDCLI